MDILKSLTLRTFPTPVKILLTATLLTLGTGYLFALTNVALKVGFFPDEVALKYYGNEASRQALEEMQSDISGETSEDESMESEGEVLSFDDLDEMEGVADEPLVPVPTLDTLVAEGHYHLFGYTSIFFIIGLIVVFAELAPWLKNTIIIAPFAASVLDIWSMLLTRFVGPGFAWMLIISGTVMALSFLIMFLISIKQLWFSSANTNAES